MSTASLFWRSIGSELYSIDSTFVWEDLILSVDPGWNNVPEVQNYPPGLFFIIRQGGQQLTPPPRSGKFSRAGSRVAVQPWASTRGVDPILIKKLSLCFN